MPNLITKKLRLEVLKDSNYKCDFCGEPATIVHHRDYNNRNNKRSNLAASCRSCNKINSDPHRAIPREKTDFYGNKIINWKYKKLITEKFNAQYLFAYAINTSPATVSRILNGRQKLTKKEAAKWQEALKPEA